MPSYQRLIAAVILLACSTWRASAQQAPPAPFRPDATFPHSVAGQAIGACSAVATDSAGNVLVFRRAEPPVLVFRNDGSLLRSFGAGIFDAPHGLRVDEH